MTTYEIPRPDGSITVRTSHAGVLNAFLLEQYRYRRNGVEIGAEPGDVVLEGGACWGDTALYFADAVGQNGRVYAFEFDPANIETLMGNDLLVKQRRLLV